MGRSSQKAPQTCLGMEVAAEGGGHSAAAGPAARRSQERDIPSPLSLVCPVEQPPAPESLTGWGHLAGPRPRAPKGSWRRDSEGTPDTQVQLCRAGPMAHSHQGQ